MAYTVKKWGNDTQGVSDEIQVEDGKINLETDLQLVGRDYYGYGEAIAQNFVDLLENFSQGQPTQYYVERNLSNVSINLYQTPNTTNTQINYNYIGRIQDVGSYTNQPDAPFRFLPCMVSGLAFYLSQKKNPQMTQTLKLYYEDELQRALTEDGQRASVHIVPQNYYVGS